ncbi:MAG: alpha/beta hydrolase [Actinocatenispora sp.]
MPVGYLVTVLLAAVCTVAALAPLRRPGLAAALSFRLGLVLNEMPFVVCYWLVASTALAAAQDDLDSPGGWAGFGLAVLTTVGLGVIARRGLRAGPVLERALATGLGPGWRDTLDAGRAARLRRRLPLGRILLRPMFRRRHDVDRIADLSYGDAGRRHRLDVYRHRSRPTGGPVLIHLHGGHFEGGRKNTQSLPLLYRLASQGWVCVSANYRLSPAVGFPEHLIDAKRVIAWVREHGHEYGADPATVFVAGSSAGGHLAAMSALTPGDPTFQPGFEQVDTSVTAAIGLNGYYGPIDSGGPPSSPAAYVRPDAPSFLVVHGDRDTVALVEGARSFVDELRAVSTGPVVYAELPGAQHSFDLFHSLRFERVVDAVEAFAAWVCSRNEATRTPGGTT